MSTQSKKGLAVVTGASAGIGAVYADRLAKRGMTFCWSPGTANAFRRWPTA